MAVRGIKNTTPTICFPFQTTIQCPYHALPGTAVYSICPLLTLWTSHFTLSLFHYTPATLAFVLFVRHTQYHSLEAVIHLLSIVCS